MKMKKSKIKKIKKTTEGGMGEMTDARKNKTIYKKQLKLKKKKSKDEEMMPKKDMMMKNK